MRLRVVLVGVLAVALLQPSPATANGSEPEFSGEPGSSGIAFYIDFPDGSEASSHVGYQTDDPTFGPRGPAEVRAGWFDLQRSSGGEVVGFTVHLRLYGPVAETARSRYTVRWSVDGTECGQLSGAVEYVVGTGAAGHHRCSSSAGGGMRDEGVEVFSSGLRYRVDERGPRIECVCEPFTLSGFSVTGDTISWSVRLTDMRGAFGAVYGPGTILQQPSAYAGVRAPGSEQAGPGRSGGALADRDVPLQ